MRAQRFKSSFFSHGLFWVTGIALYFFFFLFIKPQLYFTAQEPIFFFDKYFFKEFLAYPGGMLEYLAALLSQLYYFPMLGSATLALIFIVTLYAIRQTLKMMLNDEPPLFVYFSLILLIAAHTNYNHLLVIDLSFLTALAGASLYMAVPSRIGRISFILLFGPLLYYMAGSVLLIFSLYILTYEVLRMRDILLLVLIPVLAFVVPFVSGSGLFLIRLKQAFLFPAFDANLFNLAFFLYVSIPVCVLCAIVNKQLDIIKNNLVWNGSQAVLFLALLFSIPALTQNKVEKSLWHFTFLGRTEQWNKLLHLCDKPFARNQQIVSLINRALCHTGQLGSKMLYYTPDIDLESLFLMDDTRMSTALIRSDLYFDLGHFNESRHWAHEALSISGETVWNLQRLALLYLLYDQKAAAQIYLNKLKKSIPLRKWAQQHEHLAKENVSIKADPMIAELLSKKVDEDFLSFVNDPLPDLEKLLQANPNNKCAADYLMAVLLINKKIVRIVQLLPHFKQLDPLPRHYQEALIFYKVQAKDSDIRLSDYHLEKESFDRFQAFQTAFQKYRTTPTAAQQNVLASSFSDTFWYYVLFH